MDRLSDRQMDRLNSGDMNRWTDRQAEGGLAGRKTDRPRNRWTDTQTENA